MILLGSKTPKCLIQNVCIVINMVAIVFPNKKEKYCVTHKEPGMTDPRNNKRCCKHSDHGPRISSTSSVI